MGLQGEASAVVRVAFAAAEALTVVRVAATAVAAAVAVAAMAAAAAAATVAAVVTADVSEIHRCLRRGNGIRCPRPPARNQRSLRNHLHQRHHLRKPRYCASTTHTSHLLRRPRLRCHQDQCNSNLRLARRWIQQDNRDPNACNDSVCRVEQGLLRRSYFLPKPTHLPCRHRI